MPAVVRELEIDYGGYKVGGSSDRLLDGTRKIRVSKAFPTANVEFSFVVTGTDAASFAAACVAAETAFRTPHGNLLITLSGETLLSLSHSGNTGFLAAPEITKEGDDGDTGRSRVYTVRIAFQLPADTETPTGLREADIDLAHDASRRRTVTISGTWTAIPGTDARETYEGAIKAYADSILAGFGGTYEVIEESVSTEKEDKLAEFSIVYEEVAFSQGGASPDDPALTRQLLTIAVSTVATEDSDFGSARYGGTPVRRPVQVELSYQANVRLDETTDLPGKYQSIRGWLFGQARSVSGSGNLIVLEERPEYFFDPNRIAARITFLGILGDVIENVVEVTDGLDPGENLVPVWNGDEFGRYKFDGPAELLRTVTQTVRLVGVLTQAQAVAKVYPILDSYRNEQPNLAPLGGGGGRWSTRSRVIGPTSVKRWGTPGGEIRTTEIRATLTLEFYRPASGGGSGGGSVTPPPSGPPRAPASGTSADAGPTNRPTSGAIRGS